ncbi:MAG: hypothetical protein ACYTGO_14595 [Planctomycetota bacterium]
MAAQRETSADIVAVPETDRNFQRRLEELFKIGAPDWAEGFELALDMGGSATPPLRNRLIHESNKMRRLLWVAAYGLAARAPQALYFNRKLKGPERVLAMFVLALGPTQAEGARSIQESLGGNTDTAEAIASCLALARFGDRNRGLPKKLLSSQDPGRLAAALYVNPRLSRPEVSNRLRAMRATVAHHPLVWRGYYLAAARTAAEKTALQGRREAALRALADPRNEARKTAALLLAQNPSGLKLPADTLRGIDDETTLVLALSPALRAQLLAAGRVPRQPSPTRSVEIRRRQVVLFASSAPLPKLQDAVLQWPRTCRDLMDEICLGLALRLSKSKADRQALQGTLDKLGRAGDGDALTEAGIWLRLAQHQELAASDLRLAELSRPLQLAMRGAFTDATRGQAIEEILWERGSHPGLSGLELHRAFLFDLLLAHAAGSAVRRETYVPKGMLDPGDNFFLVARRLFEFIRKREPWALREHRLSL